MEEGFLSSRLSGISASLRLYFLLPTSSSSRLTPHSSLLIPYSSYLTPHASHLLPLCPAPCALCFFLTPHSSHLTSYFLLLHFTPQSPKMGHSRQAKVLNYYVVTYFVLSSESMNQPPRSGNKILNWLSMNKPRRKNSQHVCLSSTTVSHSFQD